MTIPDAGTDTDRVSDAVATSWVHRILPRALWPYAQLARWERPIGWWLLLWPCWWSTALAFAAWHADTTVWTPFGPAALAEASPLLAYWPAALIVLALFLVGAVAMRGAGCTYNDLVDTDIDAQVARTASRPIPSGRVSKGAAKVFMVAQALVGFLVLVALCFVREEFNGFAFWLAVASLGVVALYPFAKRVTDWPQLVLGLAFSWGALMGFAVIHGTLTWVPVALYAGCIAWTIGYDTIYAHQDVEDDALVGVRSTARLFGERTKPALVVFYGLALTLFTLAAWGASAGWPAYVGLAAGAAHMAWQVHRLDIHDAVECLRLFRSNTVFGWIVFVGFLLGAVI